jgi:hypothetical protein
MISVAMRAPQILRGAHSADARFTLAFRHWPLWTLVRARERASFLALVFSALDGARTRSINPIE